MNNKYDINIIYLSTSCSLNKFRYIQKMGVNKDVPQAQKYHRLLIEGLAENTRSMVNAISLIPTNRKWSNKLFFPAEYEDVGNVKYYYVPFINYPILKHVALYCYLYFKLSNIIKNNRDTVIICDIWNQILSSVARKIGKNNNIPVIGIVTDVPGYRSDAYKKNNNFIKQKLVNLVENIARENSVKYDGYLLLTKKMNYVVNPFNKPSLVMEGHADVGMRNRRKNCRNKKPYIAVYAGTIHKEYAIPELVQAFYDGEYNDWELHIFGDGNFAKELQLKCEFMKNIIFHGLVPNEDVIDFQLRANLIINPRPTTGDYVQYSFPSKTLEAMVSGTPLLTTKLPGIPDEYFEYIYVMEDGYDGICNGLKRVLDLPLDDLEEKGASARKFVIGNKTNVMQGKKFTEFIVKLNNEKKYNE